MIMQDVTPDMARALDLDAPEGALIAQVMPGGPTGSAGLRPRDVIAALDGVAVTDAATLRCQIGLRSPDQKVVLDFARDGKRMVVESVLGAADQTARQRRSQAAEAEQSQRLQGLSLAEDERGITVVRVARTTGAARAGMQAGDRIVTVGNTPVNRIVQLRDAVVAAPPDDPVLIEVDRQGTPFLRALPLRPVFWPSDTR
jgi:S1-C subfamily serine protease